MFSGTGTLLLFDSKLMPSWCKIGAWLLFHRKKRMRWEDRNAQRRILILSSTGSKMEWYLNMPRIYFSIKSRLLKLCLQLEELGQFGVLIWTTSYLYERNHCYVWRGSVWSLDFSRSNCVPHFSEASSGSERRKYRWSLITVSLDFSRYNCGHWTSVDITVSHISRGSNA